MQPNLKQPIDNHDSGTQGRCQSCDVLVSISKRENTPLKKDNERKNILQAQGNETKRETETKTEIEWRNS